MYCYASCLLDCRSSFANAKSAIACPAEASSFPFAIVVFMIANAPFIAASSANISFYIRLPSPCKPLLTSVLFAPTIGPVCHLCHSFDAIKQRFSHCRFGVITSSVDSHYTLPSFCCMHSFAVILDKGIF